MQLDDLIAKYLKIRDAKAELESAHKENLKRYNNALTKIEQVLLKEFNETGQDSAKTKSGTAYRSVRTSAKVADRDSFLAFVKDTDGWDFLESRVSKSAVEAFIDEHDELPPGVDVTRAVTINIRRS